VVLLVYSWGSRSFLPPHPSNSSQLGLLVFWSSVPGLVVFGLKSKGYRPFISVTF